MRSKHHVNLSSYSPYPMAFPFCQSRHHRGHKSDNTYMEKLKVNTNHLSYAEFTSPPLSVSSTISTTIPILAQALNTAPLLNSPWMSPLTDGFDSRRSPNQFHPDSDPKKETVRESHRNKSDSSMVSHSIERLISDNKSYDVEVKSDNVRDNHSRTEPDSTQPDVDPRTPASYFSQNTESVRTSDIDGPNVWQRHRTSQSEESSSPPILIGTRGIPAVGFPGVNQAALMYQYTQYAAVHQYAQEVAHQVAVAQLQAAHCAASLGHREHDDQ